MKILFFLSSSMERPSPSWHLMKALLEDVLASGISVHAIQRHFNTSTTPPFPDTILNHKLFSYSQINDKVIDRKNFIARYFHGIRYSIKARKHYIKYNDFDIVFVQSAPTSLYYILVAKHYAKNRPVLYNCQDMFPGSAVANGSMPNGWMQKIFYVLQKDVYKRQVMRTELRKRGIKRLKVVYSKELPTILFDNFYDVEDDHRTECTSDTDTLSSRTNRRQIPGSNAFVPSVAGLIIAGEVVKDLTGNKGRGIGG